MDSDQRYNIRKVGKFLKVTFRTSTDLIEFCQYFYPSVLSSFGDGMSVRTMIIKIFEYCGDQRKDSGIEALLEYARE